MNSGLAVIANSAHWRAGVWSSAFPSPVPERAGGGSWGLLPQNGLCNLQAGKHWQVVSNRCLSSQSPHKEPAVVANLPLPPGVLRGPFHTCPEETKACNLQVCNHTCENLGAYPLKMSRPGFKKAIVQILFKERERKKKRKKNTWEEGQGSTQPGGCGGNKAVGLA